MVINILAGGPIYLLPNLKEYEGEDSVWIGVDRGVITLLVNGITPNYAFGDFDSVTNEEIELIKSNVQQLRKFIPEKDETDMELALNWAVEKKPKKINIFGATGGRLDHFFANVQLLSNYIHGEISTEISIIDNKNKIFLKKPGTYTLPKLNEAKYISFLPFTPTVERLSLSGFKYSLIDRNISSGSTLCISNELIDDYGTYSFVNGILIVIRSHD